MSKLPAPNANVPQIPAPVGDLGSLAYVAQALKQAVDSLGGYRGQPLDRAVTFHDLVALRLVSQNAITSPSTVGIADIGPTQVMGFKDNGPGPVNLTDAVKAASISFADILGIVAPHQGGTGVDNSDASTITISGAFPLTLSLGGATNVSLPSGTHTLAAIDVAQTWTAAQSFNSGEFKLNGAISGAITLNAAATAGSNTITLPAGTTDFSATGGAHQVVFQTVAGGAFTVAQPAFTDISGIIASGQVSGSYTGITGVGTLTAGTWNAGVIAGQYGGTGAVNTGLTITLGGNLTTAGAFATTLTVTAATNSTLPAGTHTLAGLDVVQTWTAAQTYTNSDLKLLGSSTGATTFTSANAGVSNFTITVPAITGTLITSADTGTVTNAMLANSSMTLAGHAVSLGGTQTFAASDLTNGTTGSGAIVLATAPALSGATGTLADITGFGLRDTSAAFDLTLAATSSVALTAGRTITLDTANVAHTLAFGTTANTITFPSAASYTVAGLSVAGTWSATQTSMTLAAATLTGNTTLPNSSTLLGSTGQLILGNTANISIAGVSGMLAQVTAPSGNAGLSVSRFSADVGAPAYLLGKSRGSISTAGAVISGDGLGNFTWGGDDGSTNGSITIAAAKLQVLVDGTVSTGIVPARFAFLTMNAAGTLAERMRLDNAGTLLVGTTSGGGTAGNIVASGTVQGTQLISTIATGTAPLTVTSTTKVTNLNADQVDGANVGTSGATIPLLNGANTWSATQTSMALATATLTGLTTIPSGQLTSGGALNLGSTASITNFNQGFLTVLGTSTNASAQIARFQASATGAFINLGHSRGTTATAGALLSGDNVGAYQFVGDDGSTNGSIPVIGAALVAVVDAAPSLGVVPMRYVWQTMNTSGTFAERVRLDSAGTLLVGTTSGGGTAGNIIANGTMQANTAGSQLNDQIYFGAKTCTSTLTATSNTTLATVTGLSVALVAGKTYSISGWLSGTSGASGGIKVALVASGGLTATAARFQAYAYNGTTSVANTTVTALGSNVVAATSIYTDIYIEGSITVGVAGTINVQAAQNVSNATSTTVVAGSTFTVMRTN